MMNRSKTITRPYQNQRASLYHLIDAIVIYVALALLLYDSALPPHSQNAIVFLSISLFLLFTQPISLYSSHRTYQVGEYVALLVTVWILVSACVSVFYYTIHSNSSFPTHIAFLWLFAPLAALISWRIAFHSILRFVHRKDFNTRTAIIICATGSGMQLASQIRDNEESGIKFLGFYDDRNETRLGEDLHLSGSIEDAISLSKKGNVDIVYIALPMRAEKRTLAILDRLSNTTVNVHIVLVPDFSDYNLLYSRWHCIGNISTLSIYDTPAYGINAFLKRAEDIIFSVAMLAVCAIPMLVISLCIKLTSSGPILFTQIRHGMDNRKIRILKFRTMTVMENGPDIRQAIKNDRRVTNFGHFLRVTSLDELPQLFNVLSGTMSLVGPRPHAIAHNKIYSDMIRGYMMRHKVKPGITGLAQINGWRGETDTLEKMQERVRCDLDYINQWSLWLDLKILLLTLTRGAMIHKNAY